MAYYRICTCCGAALDPGERCDCAEKKTAADAAIIGDGKGTGTANQTNQVHPYSTGWGKELQA